MPKYQTQKIFSINLTKKVKIICQKLMLGRRIIYGA